MADKRRVGMDTVQQRYGPDVLSPLLSGKGIHELVEESSFVTVGKRPWTEEREPRATTASLSATSLPGRPQWPGIHYRDVIVHKGRQVARKARSAVEGRLRAGIEDRGSSCC